MSARVHTLSGWAKAAAVPQRKRDTESHFRLRAEIHYNDADYEDTSVETYTADFCACTEDWQYASVQFSKSKYRTVNKVFIFCDYDHNNGVALFDDIQLIRDSLETGLSAEDFPSQNYDDEVDIASAETAEEYTAPEHMERKDRFGNAVTETTFTDGEFGTIYRAFDFGARDDETTTTGNDLLRETDARGNMTHYQVDTVTSRNEIVTDRCGNKTAYEYDASGKTTKVTAKAPDGTDIATVDYSYDAYDELTAITRGDGMAYNLSYDAFHNLESIGVRGKAEQLVHYTYKNGNGRLKEITYANGDTMKAAYNALGQLVAEKWFDAAGTLTAHYRYVYDSQGNVVRSVDICSLKEYNYMYEEGRISRVTECDITVDENGMVLTRTVLVTLRYVYDQEGSLIRKHVIPEDNTCHEIFFHENDGNDNTVLKAKLNEKTYTSHSKSDSFGRKVFDEIQTGFSGISRQFLYHAGAIPEEHLNHGTGLVKSAPTTNLVKQIILSDGRTISYEYDPEERITRVIDSVDGTTEYTYDAQGQLLTETVNGVLVNAMTYDAYGNILTKNGKVYTYGDVAWKDKLTAYNGESITYDAQGNPLTYLGSTMTWEKGRQLKSLVNSEVSCGYTYNANGIRTSKTVNGVKHTYTLDGMKILRETWPGVDESGAEYTNYLFPLYDNEENICGILYNDIPYYFQKNLQGDIVAICSQDGETIAGYTYDAWGCCTISEDTSEFNIATVNPFRYRGYYYDAEIGMYYLQSRYYEPNLGRFMNADAPHYILVTDTTVNSNLFTYCRNTPCNTSDPLGYYSASYFWNYFNSLPIVSGITKFAGFAWDSKQGIWYSLMDPIQRNFGYCDMYDTLAPFAGIYIEHKKMPFYYNGKNWMVWLWKGQYGVTTGAEIGLYVYSKTFNATVLGLRFSQKWYRCAYNNERIKMAFTLYKNGRRMFNRALQTHWWLTGFKPGIKKSWEKLKMEITLGFSSYNMAKVFCSSNGLRQPSSSYVNISW